MSDRNFLQLFKKRKGQLEKRVNRDYISNGVATIPCRIDDYSDVISTYGGTSYETLEPDFVDYIKGVSDVTPIQYPLVINIVGNCLSDREKETIGEIIRDDFNYELGVVERKTRRDMFIFTGLLLFLIVSGLILFFIRFPAEIPRLVIFIIYEFVGYTMVEIFFMSGSDLRREKRLAGRLASAGVTFSDSFEKAEYSDSDVERIYSDIEKDVKRTNNFKEEEK